MSSLVNELLSIDSVTIVLEPVLSDGDIYLCFFISIDISMSIIQVDFLKYLCGSIVVLLGRMYFSYLFLDIGILNGKMSRKILPPLQMRYVCWH